MESIRNYTLGESFNPATTPEIRTAVVCHESVQNSTRNILELLGHDVIMVPDVEFDDSSIPNNRFKLLIQKYAVFEITQYQTALFMDSDAFVLKPQDLRGIFGLLDEEGSQIEGPNAKPANITWSRFKQLELSSSYNTSSIDSNVSSTKDKVMMSLDYGPDEFNSGVILYKPSATLFRDFREFLNKVILPLPEHHRGKMTRSTQRLFQEFLFSPSSHYELYSFCGDTLPFRCNRWDGCYCHTHVYPQLHGCNKDKSFLQDSATIVHFAGGVIDYDALCDPNTSPSNLEQTIQNYFATSRENHPSHADYDFECHRPIIQNIRDHYSSAIHRLGI